MKVSYLILLSFAIFLIISPISVPLFQSTAEFSIFNQNWNGCSKFIEEALESSSVHPILSPLDSFGIGSRRGTLLIIGPDLGYSSEEIEEIKLFLQKGGTLVLMDDFGTGNQILEGLNLSARFSRRDFTEIFYEGNGSLPEIIRITDPELSRGVDRITLNVPSFITGAEGEIYSSRISISSGSFGERIIMAELRYGEGRIILFSDPSVFINEMFPLNEKFIENFIERNFEGDVYVDEAHHSNFNLYQTGTVVLKREVDRNLLFLAFFSVALFSIFIESRTHERVLGFILRRFRKEEESDLKTLIESFVERGFEREKLMRIIEGIERGRKLGDWNERR